MCGPAHGLDAAELERRYWRFLTRFSRGLLRARPTPDGVVLRLAGIPVIVLVAPTTPSRTTRRWAIRGGLLTRAPGGWLEFRVHDGQAQLRLSGFQPRLPRPLYRASQERLHRWCGRRFLTDSSRWA